MRSSTKSNFLLPFVSAYFKGAQGVLKKSVLTLDNAELNVTLKKSAEKIPLDTTRLLVKGLSEETTRDALVSYMEVVSGVEVSDIEFGEHGSSLISFANSYGKLSSFSLKCFTISMSHFSFSIATSLVAGEEGIQDCYYGFCAPPPPPPKKHHICLRYCHLPIITYNCKQFCPKR